MKAVYSVQSDVPLTLLVLLTLSLTYVSLYFIKKNPKMRSACNLQNIPRDCDSKFELSKSNDF